MDGYRYQKWLGNLWGEETTEIDVSQNRQCRIYVALDPGLSPEVAEQVIAREDFGTLVIPATLKNGKKVKLFERPCRRIAVNKKNRA